MLLLNGKPVNYFKFPGGEIQVKIPDELELINKLIWKPKCSDDIMLLLMTVSALNEARYFDIELDCLYLPYARQDRACQEGEANGLSMICTLLEGLNLSVIRLYDVHNVAATLNCFSATQIINVEVHDIFRHYGILNDFDFTDTLLLAPDMGALGRVSELQKKNPEFIYDVCSKSRNFENGLIDYIDIPQVNEEKVLVIDDICDGGATFNLLAEKLSPQGKDLYLYVTTGIFSKGLDELKKHYIHIYCHHVLDDSEYQSNEFLTILRPEVCI